VVLAGGQRSEVELAVGGGGGFGLGSVAGEADLGGSDGGSG